eukprot:TRINITY_DN7997_c0_g1_i1.p1 TRINITY_DN7997_c0_g1~~TRINITY_DN7997_c0_g1_i1.p1  ORF type:complete len:282 (-),score=67.91 TRINITY_DN7997_c0_g1_i1:114-959(-)
MTQARRFRPLFIAASVGAAALLAARQLAPLPPDFALLAAPTTAVGPAALAGSTLSQEGRDSQVAREAVEYIKVPWKGSSRVSQYTGYVHRRKKIPFVRLRMDRYGTGHWPYYKIKAAFQRRTSHRSGRFLESLGYWDPMKETDDPRFFKLKADRAVFWLRQGAQPTDMVANLLDRAGLIRRTGPLAKRGEWEWRVPKTSGPDAPEGWDYDGCGSVTWNNKPCIKYRKGHPHSLRKTKRTPLIERYGFMGYDKIPVDSEVLTEPVDGSFLLNQLKNTELPIF